jgi:hypothetical protein
MEEFVNWCYNGPRWAYVENVEITQINDKGHQGFTVK